MNADAPDGSHAASAPGADADALSTINIAVTQRLFSMITKLGPRFNATRAPSPGIVPDPENYIPKKQFEKEYPHIATAHAISRDIWHRKRLGLDLAGVTVDVSHGKRVLIHRRLYIAYRLGKLTVTPPPSPPPVNLPRRSAPPTRPAVSEKRPKRTRPDKAAKRSPRR